ncbi:MAG: efflux RND transporter periplasmic adaptor subunit [Mariprofundales bacterium]
MKTCLNMNICIIITLLLINSTLLTACHNNEKNSEITTLAAAVAVQASKVSLHTIAVQESTSGVVEADQRVAIASRLSGYIRDLQVREGAWVQKNDVLFRVDPTEINEVLKQTKAKMAQAKADYSDAMGDLRRYKALLAQKAVSQQQFEKVALRANVAGHQRQAAKAAVKQVENQMTYAVVRAPFAGMVVKKHNQQGDLTTPGRAVLMLENPRQLVISTYVDEHIVGHIHENDRIRIEVPALAQIMEGEIRQVVMAGDALAHRYLVKIVSAEAEGMRPGMYARIFFAVGQRQTLLISDKSLFIRHGINYVFVIDKQQKAQLRMVRIGKKHGEQVEIAAGLEVGETLVVGDMSALRSGVLVKTKTLEPRINTNQHK